MYDTIGCNLNQGETNEKLLNVTPYYLDDCSEHIYPNGVVVRGKLGNLVVSVNEYQVKVCGGSWCKWYLGDNYQTLSRGDVERAVERLSDNLHLPMDKADVTRIDVAHNIIVNHPTSVYFNHLGQLKGTTRLLEPSGLYYIYTNGKICIYDKNKEQKAKKEPIAELYQGQNVLRYEQRYTSRIAKTLKQPFVIVSTLYQEPFYMSIVEAWKETYNKIEKINDVTLDCGKMKSKKELYKLGVLSLIERQGGQMAFLEYLAEQQKQGKLTKKQAYDIRQAVQNVCSVEGGFLVPNTAIEELDKKISDAVRFCL